MSLRTKILNNWLRVTEKRLLRRADVDQMRRSLEKKSRTFFWPPKGTHFALHGIGGKARGVPAMTIQQDGNGPHILYFHGGGYVFGSIHTHRAMLAWVSRFSGLSTSLVSYSRAPEFPFPGALIDALVAYRYLQKSANGVILGGDSAGGGLALALLGEITRLRLKQPLGTFAFSPLTDLTFSGDSLRENAERDVILPAERISEISTLYLGETDPADPRVSPLFADFTGVSPVWLVASDTEILLDDTRRLADKMVSQGVDVTCVIEKDLPHVWPMFKGYIPEAEATLHDLAQWLKALSRRSGDS